MKLDLRNLDDFPAHVVLEENASGFDFAATSASVVGAIKAEMDIIEGGDVYYCHGTAVCDADLECSRCLEQYQVKLRGEIDFSIHEVADETQVDRNELPDNELVVPAGTVEIDISGPVREALILALPFKPLCRDDCRGLCPICGNNRNEQDCECSVENIDSRWDGLRDLLKEETD